MSGYLSLLLEAKERRKQRQEARLKEYPTTLLSLSVNMPGNDKNHPLAKTIFEAMEEAVLKTLTCKSIPIEKRTYHQDISGAHLLLSLTADANKTKLFTCTLEESHPLGRFMDIDVFSAKGELLGRSKLGEPQRKCYLCEAPAHECSRAQRHTLEDIIGVIEKKVDAYVRT